MKFLSSTLIASLLLNGIAGPVSARAEDAAKLCATNTFTPDALDEHAINEKCGTGPFANVCRSTRNKILAASKEYKKKAESACQSHRKSMGDIKELGQSASQEKAAQSAQTGIAGINELLAANKQYLKEIPEAAAGNSGALKQISNAPLASPKFKANANRLNETFTRSKGKPEILKTEGVKEGDGSHISGVNPQHVKAQMDTLIESQKFVRALLMDKEANERALSELEKAKTNAANNSRNTNTPDGGKKDEGGFNPMSLLPLAAPLAGLLMQKKQQGGVSDSTSQPTDPYGQQAPAALAGTSLEPKSGGSANGATFGNSQKPETNMNMPGENYAASSSGALEPFNGDITNRNGEGKAAALGGGAGYSGSSGTGTSDSSGASASPGKGERKPASGGPAAGDEGIIGAGGGAGYSPPSSTDTPAEVDSGMKDMLHDMEATLEDSPTGLFAETDHQASADGVAAENSEALFPRVKACLVRNLKKGFVLNGLGEKLPESESH